MFDGYSEDFADYQRPTITLPSYYQLAFLPTAAGSASAADDMRERPKKEQSDEFLMYTYKVKSCSKKKSHDWTACPYAHRGEKARRRDPRKFPYSAAVCPEYRQRGTAAAGRRASSRTASSSSGSTRRGSAPRCATPGRPAAERSASSRTRQSSSARRQSSTACAAAAACVSAARPKGETAAP
uniref:AtC3H23-like CCCH zinc finger domain-containing protein n=1 Tax=Ananas comosus var. bracteatus TaxID=296719 RepID=A0A6V7Q2T4_ANACO|nr:unnamed protein product [Ananas comosus var. bracteatus]